MKAKSIRAMKKCTLRELREPLCLPGLLADALGTKREAIVRLETRPDALTRAKVGTLERYLRALGYELRLVAIPEDADDDHDVHRLIEAPSKR